jgi:hypothetical protein
MNKTYRGSCVCGAVRFEVDLDLSAGTTRCNCSLCTKSRYWMALVKRDALRILQGEDVLTDFQRTPAARSEPFLHCFFCRRCGVRPFTRGGELPAMGGEFYAVNLGALDDASDDELATAPIHYADGRHDDWQRAPAVTAYL